ncbi:trifunctional glycosyltransferase/class I SAM-dependent methyltransferase/polysaccharide deacetylase [Sphingobium estronivorans]|uniref:trifunctional glycosyltransferase/class I SAM-dependent methyltransferase/polysaccharide deacetylase n=1 Tax=Sphingobium estronivorans TaxID=1577690 RepID=UPI00123C3955|nr:trifunctional glycosyltransferase/class I SAM-dependent methyltransferase/polysaccharide deacetylase [Sphingobium estronivorans]
MAEAPRVSVIVPAYNAEATIEAALDSLAAQSFADWEAVIVDDGSTDATAAIVARRAAQDSRFRLVPGAREGAAAARNRGIALARSQWMSFLDSDDWIDPPFMATMLAALESAPAYRVAYCGYRRVMPDGTMTAGAVDPRVQDAPFSIFARTCAVTINSLMIDRQMVVDAGGFDTSLPTCEDWDLWQRLSRAGAQWLMVDRPFAYYRASPGSLTRASRQMLEDGRKVVFRAFGPDPRVRHPLPCHAAGLDDASGLSPEEAYAWFALWNMVVALTGGDDRLIDREVLAALGHGPDRAEALANTIVEALSVSLRTVPARLAARWPDYGSALDRLFLEMGQAWADPLAERRMRYALDHKLLCHDDLSAPRPLGLTLGLRMAADAPTVTDLAGPQDRLYAYVMQGDKVAAIAEPAMLGRFDLLEWVDQSRFPDPARKAIGDLIGALAAPVAIRRAESRHGIGGRWMERIARKLGTGDESRGARAEGARLVDRLPRLYPSGGHNHALAMLAVEARAEALETPRPAPAAPALSQPPAEAARDGDRKLFWDSYFAVEDPWNYGSPYEQEKYRLQLSLLPDRPVAKALELACAEGRFTAMLAEKVGHLTATDIAEPAVTRARARCEGRGNVDFAVLDLSRDPLPQDMDLIVCSEVLYYLDDVAELRAVAARLAAALAPGGVIVTAHAHMIGDDRDRTGFDWANPFGVKVIAQVLEDMPGLILERSIQTELYRVDRFRRVAEGEASAAPLIESHAMEAPLDPAVARRVIWNGAPTLRAEAVDERRPTLPVLMYHAVSDDGPDALRRYRVTGRDFRDQMRWLRSHGYHAVTGDHVQWHLTHGEPFAGRPVWITFDDGFQNFADHAWPILQGLDLTAEVFLVTDHVGGTSQWDARHGTPAPLMDAATIARLAQEGVFFGSHLASHRAADGLSSRELASELLRSRAMIERWIGWAPRAVASPFGATDGRFGRLAEQCGYGLALGGGVGAVRLGDCPFDLSRMEIRGDRTVADFAAMMEAVR